MAPIISGLDLIWRNNIDLIAHTTDELQSDSSKTDSNLPNYYWNGLIPQTIIFNSTGEVIFDKNGLVNIDDLNKIIGETKKSGKAIVPISLYFDKKGFAKLTIGVGTGKKKHDKRMTIKDKEWGIKKQRLLKNQEI